MHTITARQRRKTVQNFGEAANQAASITEFATASLRKRAIFICVAMGLVNILFAPIAANQWPSVPAFLASYHTVLIIGYFITAYIIFGFYQANHALSLLYLCCGCTYTAAMHVVEFLSIPDLILPQGTLLGGAQTANLLWGYWHAGLSTAILMYAASEWIWPGYVAKHPQRIANLFLTMLFMLTAASIVSVTTFHDSMPVLPILGDFSTPSAIGIGPIIQVVSALALLCLWRATRFRSALHVWLGVALTALFFDNATTMMGGGLQSVGWYIGRFDALISACVILLVYLIEINRVYLWTVVSEHRLAKSNALLADQVDQARLDHLTGLPGRDLFIERVAECHAINLGRGTVVAVLFIDLDGFKRVNDTCGHDHGDLVLKKTADVLRSVLRDSDIAARLGGDEFVVCLFAPFSVIQQVMIDVAGRIVAMVGEIGSGIGCSIGISLSGADNLKIETALRHADQAMYDAKKLGKNNFVIHGQPLLRKINYLKQYQW